MTDTEAIAEMCFEFADRYKASDDKPTPNDRQRWSVLTRGCHPAAGVFHGMDHVDKVEFQLKHAAILPIMLPWVRMRRGCDPVPVRTVYISIDVYAGPSFEAIAEWRARHA